MPALACRVSWALPEPLSQHCATPLPGLLPASRPVFPEMNSPALGCFCSSAWGYSPLSVRVCISMQGCVGPTLGPVGEVCVAAGCRWGA